MPCPGPHMGLSLDSLSRHVPFIYTHLLPHYLMPLCCLIPCYLLLLGRLSCFTCQLASLPPVCLPSESSEHSQRHSCKVKYTAEHPCSRVQVLTSCWAHRSFVTWSVTALHLLCLLPTQVTQVKAWCGSVCGGVCGGGVTWTGAAGALKPCSLKPFCLLSSCLFLKAGSHNKAFTGLDQSIRALYRLDCLCITSYLCLQSTRITNKHHLTQYKIKTFKNKCAESLSHLNK